MIAVYDTSQWQEIRKTISSALTIGFVPTMGCLHQGHATLIQRCKQENEVTIVSIFVNPTQFNDKADYQHYPKTIEQDLTLAADLGVDYVLLPKESELYPAGEHTLAITATTHPAAKTMEGQHRPGHFNGVLTIVMKLLQLVRPNRAYFGEKDYQQYLLVKAMATDYFLPVDIISCPTLREISGLPYSSRNSRLSPEEKQLAEQFAILFHRLALTCRDDLLYQLEKLNIKIDYLENYQNRIFIAIRIGSIRLIDNISL